MGSFKVSIEAIAISENRSSQFMGTILVIMNCFWKCSINQHLYSFYAFYKTYPEIFHTAFGKSQKLLSWSHYAVLLQVDDEKARAWYPFYELCFERGIIVPTEEIHHKLPLSEAYAPKGVICLLSAAVYYHLTIFIPDAVDVAIPRKVKISTMPDWPQMNVHHYTDDRHELGVTTIREGKNEFRIYDMEKTVVDIVFYREKVGIEETKEILVLTAYGLEKTVYRLLVSEYVENFTLKGGIFLYALFEGDLQELQEMIYLFSRMTS